MVSMRCQERAEKVIERSPPDDFTTTTTSDIERLSPRETERKQNTIAAKERPRSLSTRAEKPHPVAKSRVNARNRTKTLSHIQPSGSKAYASNERLFAARDEAPQRAFKSSRVHRPPRFPTFKAQRSAIFSFAGDSSFARKIKKIQIHATTRRKDATVQSATRRAHRIAKYQYRIQKHKERERERERRMCLCAPGTACFFSTKSFLWFL